VHWPRYADATPERDEQRHAGRRSCSLNCGSPAIPTAETTTWACFDADC
jgi:hypothetical protein